MLQPGTTLHDRYRIDKLVGVGGMGLVYQAYDRVRDERVAIKVMRRAMLGATTEVDRFRRETRALSRLDHPSIVRVFDEGVLDNGSPFMAMELLIGRDLRAEARERGPLPISEVAGYMIQVCEAVHAAHEQGVIHRDLKPQNLFLTNLQAERQVKLLDFGISKPLLDEEVSATASSVMIGTPHYMSPEQVRAARDIDHRTDIWSLGVVLYALTTGQLPFANGSPTAVIAAIPVECPPRPTNLRPDMPAAMERIILRCLQKSPARRYQTARKIAEHLAPLAPARRVVLVEGARAFKSLPPLPMPNTDSRPIASIAVASTVLDQGHAADTTAAHKRVKSTAPRRDPVHEAVTVSAPAPPHPVYLPTTGSPRPDRTALANHSGWLVLAAASILACVTAWSAAPAQPSALVPAATPESAPRSFAVPPTSEAATRSVTTKLPAAQASLSQAKAVAALAPLATATAAAVAHTPPAPHRSSKPAARARKQRIKRAAARKTNALAKLGPLYL